MVFICLCMCLVSLCFAQERSQQGFWFDSLLFNLGENQPKKNRHFYVETLTYTNANNQITPWGPKFNIFIEAKVRLRKINNTKQVSNYYQKAIYVFSEFHYPHGTLDLNSLIEFGLKSEYSASKLEELYPIVVSNYEDSTRYLHVVGFR